ncbi:VQ domain-containing protein [Heracleum sosnowskyi]|uniref:VQ domain-containing protein n=1 Tax=Heracleum sosnowskyi TaxID=360622 RepID=A0AAD8MHZ2_9APIA|nr:VQ domain-containing protein [Heracleum sosnowskyi]
MDMSRVHHVVKSQNMKKDRRKTLSINKKPVKVVYVATPVKVNISASNFRALVQELTGRESDLSRFEDFSNFNADSLEKSWEREDDSISHGHATVSNNSNYSDNGNSDDVTRPVISSYSVNDTDYGNYENVIRPVIHEFQSVAAMVEDSLYEYSPSSSESLLDSFDDVVSSQIVEELEQMFPSNLFGYESGCISHENDVLGDVYGVV